jgi:hypothetical protein
VGNVGGRLLALSIDAFPHCIGLDIDPVRDVAYKIADQHHIPTLYFAGKVGSFGETTPKRYASSFRVPCSKMPHGLSHLEMGERGPLPQLDRYRPTAQKYPRSANSGCLKVLLLGALL